MEPKILLKTCHVDVNLSINISILFNEIEIGSTTSDEYGTLTIKGTRFQDKSRGVINEVKNNANKRRKDFSNQCSVTGEYITNDFVTKVNFKVFNNGNIIITGVKHNNNVIKNVLRLFLKNISHITYTLQDKVNCLTDFLNMFNNSYENYSKFINNHYTQLLKLMNIYKTIDIGIFDIINNTNIYNNLETFIKPIWNDDIYNFINLFYICYYYSSKNFMTNLDNEILKQIVLSDNRVFPLSFDLKYDMIDDIVNNVEVVIENINAMINFDFILDRSKFYNYVVKNALNTEPRSNPDFVDFISFEQTMYQGINIKYQIDSTKTNKTKYITFLVFQEGKILISGLQNEEQLQEYSQKILNLINSKRELYDITTSKINPISTCIHNYPSFTGELNNKSIKIIHYTKLIDLNPRNYYIIKHLSK